MKNSSSSLKQMMRMNQKNRPFSERNNFDNMGQNGYPERCYRKTIIWYAKFAPTKHKCFIACECVNSHPGNPYLIYESRHKNRNPNRKWVSNTIICTPERGVWIWKAKFRRRKWKHNAVQFTWNCRTLWFINLRNVEQSKNRTGVFPKFLPTRKIYVTLQIRTPTWNQMRKWPRKN